MNGEGPITVEAMNYSTRPNRDRNTKRKPYLILCYVSFICIISSILVGSIANFLSVPDDDDDDDDYDNYSKAKDTYFDRLRILSALSNLLRTCGGCFLAFGLIFGCITDKTLSNQVKLGFAIAAGLIIAYLFSRDIVTALQYPYYYLRICLVHRAFDFIIVQNPVIFSSLFC